MQLRTHYLYTVWFLDEAADADDEDCEWPACFVVEAATQAEAQRWGDQLANGFADRNASERYVKSSVEIADLDDPGVAALPRVVAGVSVPDAHIGW